MRHRIARLSLTLALWVSGAAAAAPAALPAALAPDAAARFAALALKCQNQE